LSDTEAFNMIFEPGFSTANKVTDISGRGVGLDVVKKHVEKLNGTASVTSTLGAGSTFTIRLPLTLAIIQGMLVRVGKEIYAIPINSVVESLRLRTQDIKMIDGYEVFNVRDDVLSLLRLGRLFRIPTEENKPYHFIIVVGTGDKRVGLMVDSLIGEEDLVIKPLRDRYTVSPGIAGATILGDGTVALILDVAKLLEFGLQSERLARQGRQNAFAR
jgi:two-component system, chemotaxis family, sensor kinase CheA